MIFCVENDTDFDPQRDADIADMETLCARIGDEVLAREGVADGATVEASLYLVGEDAIREMNLMHRDINAATDVLSFPNIDFDGAEDIAGTLAALGPDSTDPETGRALLGDIVINTARVLSQAEAYGHSPKREFAFLLTHSLLHLLGYDHETPAEAAIMEEKQEAALGALGITRG